MSADWLKSVRGTLLVLALLSTFTLPLSTKAASVGQIQLAGIEYWSIDQFAARFGLKTIASKSERTITLQSAWTTIELEADSRECLFNGVRLFLGDAVRESKGSYYISRLDAEKRLTPLLLPGSGVSVVPQLRTIVVDAGHGGRDPGKENTRLKVNEKEMALDTAKRLKRVLELQGYRVILTRDSDQHLDKTKAGDLRRRAEIANEEKADLFISLHYNAVGARAQKVSGVEVYTLTPQTQFSTADPQQKDHEGAAVMLIGNANDHWNTVIGYQVQRRMIKAMGATDRGVKHARWAVLRFAECPAILIESGFLSNDSEARKIMQPGYRQKIAEAIGDAVQTYGNIVTGARKRHNQP